MSEDIPTGKKKSIHEYKGCHVIISKGKKEFELIIQTGAVELWDDFKEKERQKKGNKI